MNEGIYSIILKGVVTPIILLIIKSLIERYSKNSLLKGKSKLDMFQSFLAWPIESRHPALVEETFKEYFGTRFKYSEIVHVLSLRNPMFVFTKLKRSFRFLDFDENLREFKLIDKLDTSEAIKSRKKSLSWWYFFTGFISLFPLFWLPNFYSSADLSNLTFCLAWCLFVAWYALSQLDELANINGAECIIEEQKFKHKIKPSQ